ncbi:hypothetical protein BT69DRAFT_1333933 [Atractiella rhizophila]|nr:hypothetical protein BT69DRAFT_1333933 [Atractiella rhizophila]
MPLVALFAANFWSASFHFSLIAGSEGEVGVAAGLHLGSYHSFHPSISNVGASTMGLNLPRAFSHNCRYCNNGFVFPRRTTADSTRRAGMHLQRRSGTI